MTDNKAHAVVLKARTALLLDQPFFGCLAMQLKLVEVKEGHWLHGTVDTMAVDGYHMYYFAPFVLKLSETELMGVVAHEVLHCAYRHFSRRGHRDGQLWNCAGDFVINADLKKANFTLPGVALGLADMFGSPSATPKQGHLFEPKFDGMGSEEVYERLQQQMAKQPKCVLVISHEKGKGGKGQGQGKGQGKAGKLGIDPAGCGGVIDAGSGPGEADEGDAEGKMPTAEQISRDWEANVRMAVGIAKQSNAGSIPGYLQRLVNQMQKPKISWRDYTRNFIDGSLTKEFSWARPNRRSAALGILLPGMVPDALHHLVMLIDISGSISNALATAMVSEGGGALDDGIADKLTIAYFDTEIKHVDEYVQGDLVTCNAPGGGGTDFRPAYQWVIDKCDDASCVIMLTDMMPNSWDLPDPGVPVLWGAYCPEQYLDHVKPPFGEVVHVDSSLA